ncbi:MAG TPA: NifU family protein [Candidatus Acidoferrales bacterium]|nr:NifU family protein [Candidatus Acidoferrales bacterium]
MSGHAADSGSGTVRASGVRVEELLAEFERPSPIAHVRGRAEELVRTLVGLYGAGIERILEIVDANAGDRAGAIFAALGEDELSSGLMAIHGLHPESTADRVQRALDGVRPYVESHRGSVEVLAIEDGVVWLRMSGSCDGCPSSAVTLKLAIEKAILEACPELSSVRAEGVSDAAEAPATLRVLDPLPT